MEHYGSTGAEIQAYGRRTQEVFMKEPGGENAVLFIGEDPNTVDFSAPALPPGLDAEKIEKGIAFAMKQMADRKWRADLILVRPDASAGPAIERQLASSSYDCVVIGAGIRLPPGRLQLFEQILNVIHRVAPGAAIAFNTSPQDTAEAAARWL
jgi:hypothetical protein